MQRDAILPLAAGALVCAACGRVGFDGDTEADGDTRSRRIEIVDTVSGTLPGFPLLVQWGADPAVAAAIAAGLDQIAFKDASGARLAHELERLDPASGALTAWVRADIATGTVLHFRLGAAQVAGEPRAVWADYEGVWHFSGGGAGARFADATGKTPNAAPSRDAAVEPARIESSLRPRSGWLTVGDHAHLDFRPADSFTVSQWVRFDRDTGTYQTILYKGGQSNNDPGYGIETSESFGTIFGCLHNGDGTSQTCTGQSMAPIGTWMYLALIVDRTTQRLRLWIDGDDGAPGADIAGIDPDAGSGAPPLQFGAKVDRLIIDGMIDEVRIARTALSTARLAAEHRNQLAPEQFIAMGPLE